MHQNKAMLRRMTSANGAALMNGKNAMSGGGGYTMALVARDRVDYSVAKGGLRQWAVLFVFAVLASSLYTVFSSRNDLNLPLDLDGDGDIDDMDNDNDDEASLHADKKLEKEKDVRETPSRSPGDKPPGERRRKEGGSSGGAEVDTNDDDDADEQENPVRPEPVDDEDDDDEEDGVDDGDDDDDDNDTDVVAEEKDEELDEAELRAKEVLMLRALKDKAEARRRERAERRIAKKAAKQARTQDDDDADDGDDDNDATPETAAEKTARRKAAAERRQVRPATAAPPQSEPEPEEEKSKEPIKVRFTRKRGRKHNVVVPEEAEEEKPAQEAVAAESEDKEDDKDDKDEEEEPVPAPRRKAKGHVKGRKSKLLQEDDDNDDEETPDEEPVVLPQEDLDTLPKEVPVIRYTRTKGKFPKKPKRKPREEEDEEEEEKEPEAPPKRASNARRQRHTVSVQAEVSESCIQKGNCGEDETEERLPIEVRYFRTKGNLHKRQAPQTPAEEEEDTDDNDDAATDEKHTPPTVEEEKEEDEEEDGEEEAKEVPSVNSAVEQKKSLKVRPRSADLSNAEDMKIRATLDAGDKMLNEEHKFEEARRHFEGLLAEKPDSPRAHYGVAKALDRLSERHQSNDMLQQAIEAYENVLELPGVPDKLYLRVLGRLVERARFRGWPQKALAVQKAAVERFPLHYDVHNELGLTYLIMGRAEDAKRVFAEVLADDAENGFAMTHYGFILKTVDEDLQGAVSWMSRGLATGADGTDQARFYFHLGDALQRLGKKHQAYKIYDEGARKGYFASRLQRSLYNVPGLTARPWWSLRQTGVQAQLEEIEKHWKTIRDEGLALMDSEGTFRLEDEKLTSAGDWRQLTLYQRGRPLPSACEMAPRTCALVAAFPDSATCKRGQVKFSVMAGGTRVHPHCGPTNCRLRGHLGLVTPIEPRIRVGNETRAWKLGKWVVFDDSFEHEVWHEGTLPRLVLILDFWHPGLSAAQRAALSPI